MGSKLKVRVLGLCLVLMLTLVPSVPGYSEEVLFRAAGGSLGGLFYVFTTAWTKIVESAIPGSKVQIEATGGGIANLRLLSEGTADIGLTSTACYEVAERQTDWAAGQDYTHLRVLFPVYPSPITIFTLRNDIHSLDDLNGKIICPGPKQAGGDVFVGRLKAVFDIKPKSIINANFSDLVQILKDRQADVAVVEGGHPHSTASELEQTHQVKYIELTEEEMAKMAETYSAYKPIVLGPGLKYMAPEYKALTTWCFASVRKDFSDEFAYLITKASFEKHSDLLAAVASAREMKIENVTMLNCPIHPGAIRYYEEIGVDIPSHLIPPEYNK